MQSSVNNRVVAITLAGRSLMKRRKSSDPSTVPWGSPLSPSAFSDVPPSMMTCCVRCLRNDVIHWWVLPKSSLVIKLAQESCSILKLQSSWRGRESWLLCLICLPGVPWWLSGSSSRCHGVVCSLWLWYFLIILTYYSMGTRSKTLAK